MRLIAIVVTLSLLAVVPASAQAPASAQQHPYGLDPYKPSDAALLRQYGATLVALTPLSELQKLDPYKPSHAALLRQLGGAIPVWGLGWFPPVPIPTPLTPFPTTGATGVRPTGSQLVVIVVTPNDRLAPPRLAPDPLREPDPLVRPGLPRPAPNVQVKAPAP